MRNWMKRAVPAALVAGSLLALAAGTASADTPLPFTPDPAAVLDVVTNTTSALDAVNGTSVLPADQGRSFGPTVLPNLDLHQISMTNQNIGGGPIESLPLSTLPVKLPVGVPGAASDERSMASTPGLNAFGLNPATQLSGLPKIPGLTATMLPNIAVPFKAPTNMLGGVDQASQLTAVPGQDSDARELPGANLLTTATHLLSNKAPKNGS